MRPEHELMGHLRAGRTALSGNPASSGGHRGPRQIEAGQPFPWCARAAVAISLVQDAHRRIGALEQDAEAALEEQLGLSTRVGCIVQSRE